jgi:hypothetical protein
MAEMDDYSGEFKPDFQFSDLSKEALVRLIEHYQRIFQGFSVVALDVLQEELGKDEAQTVLNKIYWREMERFSVPLVRKALKLDANDVISMFKYFQVAPDGCRGGGMYDFDFQVDSKNDVTYVGKYCQNAFYYEKVGDEDGMNRLCAQGPGSFEHNAYEIICKLFNPDMKMEWPLLPPRKDKSAPFCRWRFWIDEKAEKADEQKG